MQFDFNVFESNDLSPPKHRYQFVVQQLEKYLGENAARLSQVPSYTKVSIRRCHSFETYQSEFQFQFEVFQKCSG